MVVGYLGNVEVKAYRVSGIFPCCFGVHTHTVFRRSLFSILHKGRLPAIANIFYPNQQPLTRTRRAVHVLPSLSNPAIRSYLERVLEKRRLLQDAILEEAKVSNQCIAGQVSHNLI